MLLIVSAEAAGVLHETFKLAQHIVGARGNILRGCQKIVHGRRIGVNTRDRVFLRRLRQRFGSSSRPPFSSI